MKHTRNVLMTTFCVFLAVSAVLVVLFEAEILPTGLLKTEEKSDEFVLLCLMELLTICVIPLALRLFRFGSVARRLTTPKALLHWAGLRLYMLCVPMVANLLLYYLYFNVAFGYMGIILLLCLFFVVPTQARCESELYVTETPSVS